MFVYFSKQPRSFQADSHLFASGHYYHSNFAGEIPFEPLGCRVQWRWTPTN